MALSGLDIYKLLPKTNCRECGFATCLAFAMQLAKKAISIDKCPHIDEEAKRLLQESSLPPIKLVSIGEGESKLDIGNETVLFRHEEKFHNPCGIGFIIEDKEKDAEIKAKLAKINKFKFERIGQELNVNVIAVKQGSDAKRFIEAVRLVKENSKFPLIFMSSDSEALKGALEITKGNRPLLFKAQEDNLSEIAKIAKDYNAAVVAQAKDLDSLSSITKELNNNGISDIVLDAGEKSSPDNLWDLTQIRRQALKKSNRSLGYPTLVIIDEKDPFEETMKAAGYIAKYASIILIKGVESWQVLSLLTLRQNIYTDPQKPLQIEPKLYSVGQVNDKSPVLVTTNFSLTYYTVLSEVEASKVPSYIISIDTEGMSVLTAWAAEKLTPDKISDSIDKFGLANTVSHKRLIIPGYVAVLSGELEDKSSWQVVVGPKEASGIPSFLKNLQ